MTLTEDEVEIYREGFADGLRWVLGNCNLDPEDEERIIQVMEHE